MSINEVEQRALSAFLAASAACMEEPDEQFHDRCEDLRAQAAVWEMVYVRELTRPLLSAAG